MIKRKVLIVEDEVIIAMTLSMDLQEAGYEVCAYVSSGEEAVWKAEIDKPDYILMDICISGNIDGIDTAKQIINNKKIPIIFMTGYDNEETRKRAEAVDYLAYLIKPVELKEVINLIEKAS